MVEQMKKIPSIDLFLASILLNRFEPLAPHHAGWIRERLGERNDEELREFIKYGKWTHDPLPAPKTKEDLAAQIRWLAEHMKDIATSMKMVFTIPHPDGIPYQFHGYQLEGAAKMCLEWAENIEKESK